jgi:cytochrome P450
MGEVSVAIDHPFYLDSDGINRPPGPERHPRYGEFAAAGTEVVPITRTVNGRRIPAYLVCRYADVREVLRRQDVFSRTEAAYADDVDVSGTILGMDGSAHAAVRGIVKDAFSKAAVAELYGMVEKEAATQLAALVSRGRQGDLVEDFSLPFSLHTICDLLGLPREDRLKFRAWGDMFLGTADLARDQAARAGQEMAGYLWEQIERRRGGTSGGLLTHIAVAGADRSPDVQVKLALALVVGGWETSAGSIARFVYVLRTRGYAGYATAWDYLLDHPDEADAAVTELERLYPTTTGDDMPRRVMADVELPSGTRLSEGDIVIPSHDAANRDPRVFEDPERMDFGRDPNPHLSYGYGAHFCVGAHLGALEIRTAIRLLLRDLPALRLAVPSADVRWKAGHSIMSLEALPVTW